MNSKNKRGYRNLILEFSTTKNLNQNPKEVIDDIEKFIR